MRRHSINRVRKKRKKLNIKILGTRGEIEESAPYHAKHSGLLIDDTLLLDCGDKRFLHYNPRAILITHLHPDHAYFVRHHAVAPIRNFVIYAPDTYPGLDIIVTRKPFTIGSYHITPIPTVHSLKVRSHAYLIEHNKKRILYTGDMIWIDKKYRHLLKPCNAIITEASFFKAGGMIRRDKKTGKVFGHTGVPNLIKLFAPYTPTIILIHFGAWFYKNMPRARAQIASLGKEYDRTVIAGYDGQKIAIH